MENFAGRYSRGKCQENTIIFCLPKIPFNIAGLEHLWCECSYGEVNVKQTPYGNFMVHVTQKAIDKFDIEFCGRKFLSKYTDTEVKHMAVNVTRFLYSI